MNILLEKVIDGLYRERLPSMEIILNLMYEERLTKEIKKIRVTSLIYPNTMQYKQNDKSNPNEVSGAINTYWHNTLQDIVCQHFFKKLNLFPYKEEFIYHAPLGLKGHADIVLYSFDLKPIATVEIKNYRKTLVDTTHFNRFVDQILIYSRLLNINTFYLVIRNFDKIEVWRYTMDKIGFSVANDLLNERYDKHLFTVQTLPSKV